MSAAASSSSPVPEKGEVFVTLCASDGTTIRVPGAVCERSRLVVNMMEEVREGEETMVPLFDVDHAMLRHVVDYLEHYHGGEEPAKVPRPMPKPLRDIASEWDMEFLERFDLEGLYAVTLAANYMDIKPLIKLATACIYDRYIRSKSAEEIRETFGLEDDLTEEDKAAIREENRWCEEV